MQIRPRQAVIEYYMAFNEEDRTKIECPPLQDLQLYLNKLIPEGEYSVPCIKVEWGNAPWLYIIRIPGECKMSEAELAVAVASFFNQEEGSVEHG